MKPQAFQRGELRDEHDQIIRAGAYGKKTPFVSADNNAILDYIMNNFDALYAQIPNGRAYVKSVNNITPDSNGNVTINLGSGGGGTGTNITVDSALSSTSTNPVQNKVLYAALNNKLDKNGVAAYAACDSSGNIISNTYARKTELSGYVKSINNVKPDSAGNVNISSSGGGSNITVDATLSGTSNNAIANKAVYAALENKLDKTDTAAAATKATQDSYGNVIVNTYARKSDLSGYVKTINNMEPDTNGNINISTGGGGGSGNYLPLTGGTVNGGITATNFKTGTEAANYFQCRKFRGEGDANSYYHAVDFGYSGHDSVDFYEYDPNWNFYKCTTGTKSGAVLVGNINGNGWNGGARLTGAPTAPTAAVGTNTTQIATTAFVQAAVGGKANSSDLANFVTTSGQNTWRAQQTFDLATLSYEQYSSPHSSTNSGRPSTSAASYYATGAFTLNLSTLSALLGSNQSTVFSAYITAGGDYALSITNGGTIKYIGEASDVAITSAGLLLNILMTKDSYGSLTSIVQANKLT
nr:MAG TPA: Baseplate wedge protein [Caudoviricetes sp.]